ncbi:uncharacterized protein LOC132604086 [Lycium barbarum]|uniref:uncharacterized protein LOC132604086 n=1 Tax=Lycium barbarum TaxID=112863 RepID=UPI00293F2A96|nr:uncharacterized protein LOC132604086 [Lycium barbarum]
MFYPGRGKCQKRKRDGSIPLQVVHEVPWKLWTWWNEMDVLEHTKIFKHMGFLTNIMKIDPRRDVIDALLSFWDPTKNVFRFSDFELTPTLEEIAGYTGLGENLHRQKLAALRLISVNSFLTKMNIAKRKEDEKKKGKEEFLDEGWESLDKGWVSLEFLYERYGRRDGFERLGKRLSNKGNFEIWKDHSRFTFMVAFLGIMVFPRRGQKINIRLAGIVDVLTTKKDHTIVPMILADIYRALTVCQKGKGYFEGCNILLQMWIMEHIFRPRHVARFVHDRSDYISSYETRVKDYKQPDGVEAWIGEFRSLTSDKITWNFPWFPWREVIYTSTHRPFLLLMGIRGVQSYVPLRVLRQLGRRQIIPVVEDMTNFVFEVRPEIPLPEGLVVEIWNGCRVMTFDTMVTERHSGEVHPGYPIWLENQPVVKVQPKRSAKGPVDYEAEMDIKIAMAMKEHHAANLLLQADLERARASLAQQQMEYEEKIRQARLEVGADYQSTLQTIHTDLEHARAIIQQRDVEIAEERAKTAALQGKLQLATIRGSQIAERAKIIRQGLQERLSILEEDMHQQQNEFERKEEQFKKEKAEWLRSQDKLHEKLEEAKRNLARQNIGSDMSQLIQEREMLQEKLESVTVREKKAREEAAARELRIKELEYKCGTVRGRVRGMAIRSSQAGLEYERLGYEQFHSQIPTFVNHLTRALQGLYKDMGGQLNQSHHEGDKE